MTIISRPLTICLLLAIFLVTWWLGGPANSVDVAVIHWLVDARKAHPDLTGAAIAMTQMGSVYATLGMGVIASIVLALRRKHRAALLLAGTVAIERLVTDGLKLFVGRPRPDFDLHPVVTSSSSFPSGHSANSMTAFTAIALLAVPPTWRKRAFVVAVAASLVVGATRPYLGVHWPSDVIGGWALGLIVAGLSAAVANRSGAIEPEHDIVGGHRAAIGQDEAA